MYQRFMSIAFLLLLLTSCEYLLSKALHKEGTQPVAPNIEDSWASDLARPGEVWKVYLIATDLDGNMKAIHSLIEQKGAGVYPLSITPLKPEYQKEFNGFIYLNIAEGAGRGNAPNSGNLTLTVRIQDKAGNFSTPVNFPLSFDAQYAQKSPPNYFKENNLGPVRIEAQSNPDHTQ